MRVKKYLALIFAAILATTMLTGCPWDIEDDTASDSSSAPSSSSRPSHDSSDDDSGSAPSSPSTPDDEESENPDPIETLKQYGTVEGTTLTITDTRDLEDNDTFRNALNSTFDITTISFGTGVTSIPRDTFQGCTNLTSVELGSVTSIGGHAFDSCTKLTSIDLSNVETIDANAFSGCTNLAHIRLGAGIQATYVTTNAFDGIAKTVHVYYGTSKEEAQAKWEELGLNYNGTVIYHPDSDWENLENNDNATDALPGAMKGLLALTERLG